MEFMEIPLNKAYCLINAGPVVMISSVSKDKKYNTAPIAWASPARKEPTQILICIGKRHKTFSNISETKVFSAGIPNINQAEMIKAAGSVSGNETDKFKNLDIASEQSKKIDCLVPAGMIGNIECRVVDVFETDLVAMFLGEAVYASADPAAYNGERLLSELPAGKTVHHLGNKLFMTLGGEII